MTIQRVKSLVTGVGGYLPERIVTNEDLMEYMDTNHQWIVERTGIHKRHFADKDETTSDLATKAARLALDMANLKPNDIDMIVLATATPDHAFPSTAALVQGKLGMTRGLAFDVAGVCAGFIVALNVADTFIKTNQAKRILVIGAEIFSRLMNISDRRTAILFADGAGAVILEATPMDNPRGIMGIHMQSDGRLSNILYTHTLDKKTAIHMEGRELFRHAVVKLAHAAEAILEQYTIHLDDLDWFIPHQANIRIIEGVAKKLNLSMDKVIATVGMHANTSAASIPLALNEAVRQGKVKAGDLILHEAIGSGLVWGAGLIRF